MLTYIPVSTIAEGMGLNVTVHSYLDELEFGLIACRELVPDLWHLVDLHLDEIDVLFAAAGVPRRVDGPDPEPKPATTTAARKTAARKTATKKTATKKTATKKTVATKTAGRKPAAKKTAAKKPAARATASAAAGVRAA